MTKKKKLEKKNPERCSIIAAHYHLSFFEFRLSNIILAVPMCWDGVGGGGRCGIKRSFCPNNFAPKLFQAGKK